jgi:hypothetical protein
MEMFKNILKHEKLNKLEPAPRINRYEAHNLIEGSINPEFAFSRWLLNV